MTVTLLHMPVVKPSWLQCSICEDTRRQCDHTESLTPSQEVVVLWSDVLPIFLCNWSCCDHTGESTHHLIMVGTQYIHSYFSKTGPCWCGGVTICALKQLQQSTQLIFRCEFWQMSRPYIFGNEKMRSTILVWKWSEIKKEAALQSAFKPLL